MTCPPPQRTPHNGSTVYRSCPLYTRRGEIADFIGVFVCGPRSKLTVTGRACNIRHRTTNSIYSTSNTVTYTFPHHSIVSTLINIIPTTHTPTPSHCIRLIFSPNMNTPTIAISTVLVESHNALINPIPSNAKVRLNR